MWKRTTVNIGGNIKTTMVAFEGAPPGVPGTVEWDEKPQPGTRAEVRGETFFTRDCSSAGGYWQVELSREPPPERIDYGPRAEPPPAQNKE